MEGRFCFLPDGDDDDGDDGGGGDGDGDDDDDDGGGGGGAGVVASADLSPGAKTLEYSHNTPVTVLRAPPGLQ